MNKAKNVSAAVMAALIFVASLAFGGCDDGGEKNWREGTTRREMVFGQQDDCW